MNDVEELNKEAYFPEREEEAAIESPLTEEVKTKLMTINDKLDPAILETILISSDHQRGAVRFLNMRQVVEQAKTLAITPGVSRCLIGNVAACTDLIMQAIEWRMPYMGLARKCYIAKPGQPISYESQVFHALVENSGMLKGRIRYKFEGEGDKTTCTVIGYLKGEDEPFIWQSPMLGKRRPPPSRKNPGVVAGSPLWVLKPFVQLAYDTMRDWARMYLPDVVLGCYSYDEMLEETMQDITPKHADPFADKLPLAETEHVDGEIIQPKRKAAIPEDILALTDMRALQALDLSLQAVSTPEEFAAIETAFGERIGKMAEENRAAASMLVDDYKGRFGEKVSDETDHPMGSF